MPPQDLSDGCPKHSQPTPLINLEHFREPRPLKFVGVRDFENKTSQSEMESLTRLLTYLNRTSLIVSGVLFLCQIGAAICLCRPVTVLGGVLVSLLFLCQGILGNYIFGVFSQVMLVGYSCLSAFVALAGMGSAIYLLFNNFTEACLSSFHTDEDPAAVTRLNVVKAISLVAAVPCLLGSIACFLSSTLAAKASKQPMKTISEPQLFLYLHENTEKERNLGVGQEKQDQKGLCISPSAPVHQETGSNSSRSCSPPPSYYQANEESFA